MPGFFGGYRVKKRTFAVAGIALAISLAAAGMIALYASTLLGANALVRFQLTEDPQGIYLPGSGVSMSAAPSRNLIEDGSFEPLVFKHFLTAYGGDEISLTASSEDAGNYVFDDGFFEGAAARIMSQTAEGLSLKKLATVTRYGLNHVGVFQSIRLPADMPAGLAVSALERWQSQVVAVGRQGLIMIIESNQVSAVPDSGIDADLTDVCVFDGGIVAVSEAGDVIFSEDGMVWQRWQSEGTKHLNAAAADSKGEITAVGDDGVILTGQNGRMSPAISGTNQSLRAVLNSPSGWYAIGDAGTVLHSSGGLVWRDAAPDRSGAAWRAAASIRDTVILVGDKGRIAVSTAGDEFTLLPVDEHLVDYDLIDVLLLTETQYIALDSSGRFLISHDGGTSWNESGVNTGMIPRAMILAGKDRLISADATGLVGTAQLVAEIQLDSPLLEGTFQAGDLIYLEMDHGKYLDEPAENGTRYGQVGYDVGLPWQVSEGANAIRSVDTTAPGSGTGVLELSSEGDAFISQTIPWKTLADQQEGAVFRLSCWMRQENLNKPVMIWITGLENSAGTRFNVPDSKWRSFGYSFVIPSAWIRQGQDITIHVGFEDGGTVWIDDLSLIPAADEAYPYRAVFQNQLIDIRPSVIRLANVPFGKANVPTDSWTLDPGLDLPVLSGGDWQIRSGVSLAPGLELARSCAADPWLSIDSSMSEIGIANLMEYLAAPVSEPFGRLRLEQGAPVPWTDVFTRIYLEVNDSSGLFGDDRLRSDYVDWVIEQISVSPYYLSLKNLLIFVDGMPYSQGVMQSAADYHASDLMGGSVQSIYDLEEIYLDFWAGKPRNPEKSLQSWPELIRSVRLPELVTDRPDQTLSASSVSVAELTALLLFDLGDQSSLALLDMDQLTSASSVAPAVSASVWTVSAGILSAAARGEPYNIERLTANDTVFAMAARSEERFSAVLGNLGDQPLNCQLSVQEDISGATVHKYDEEGGYLGSEPLRRNESQVTVLPGGVVLIEKSMVER